MQLLRREEERSCFYVVFKEFGYLNGYVDVWAIYKNECISQVNTN
jgi:hypothetical protein